MVTSLHSDGSAVPWRVLCDFDGTVTPFDVTDAVLGRFADDVWSDVEAEWIAGVITARQCMERQVRMIRASREELDAFLDTVPVDPAFPAFVAWCRRRGIPLTIVSDGLDYAIGRVLARHGHSAVPYLANSLVSDGASSWRLAFPHGNAECGSGMCKCHVAGDAGGVVLIGDGRSDCCVASRASLVLAKRGKSLEVECVKRHYHHLTYDTFEDIPLLLERNLTAC